MDRIVGPASFVLVALATLLGCSRGSSQPSLASTDASMPAPSPAAGSSASPQAGADAAAASLASPASSSAGVDPLLATPAVFSAPIAGLRVRGELVVAGLVVGAGGAGNVVRVTGLTPRGPEWSVDILPGVGWLPDSDLKLRATADGLAVLWRGTLAAVKAGKPSDSARPSDAPKPSETARLAAGDAGKAGTTLVLLGPHGELHGESLVIGAASCATDDGAAWIDPRPTGPVRVRSRRWSDPPREVATLSPDRAPTLVCADHAIFVLGDGDADVNAATFVAGEPPASPSVAVIRDDDFGDDDERDHYAYTFGDDLGLVRVASSGALAQREVPHGPGVRPSPWHRVKHKLPEDDDVVAVDGDATATVVLSTRDASEACGGGESAAASARALRVDRKTGEESVFELAKPDCDRAPGPFWIASAPGSLVAAWTLRTGRPGRGSAPIVGLGYRTLESDRAPSRVDVSADALADAGCDDTGCYAVALMRVRDDDGGRPQAIRTVRYP